MKSGLIYVLYVHMYNTPTFTRDFENQKHRHETKQDSPRGSKRRMIFKATNYALSLDYGCIQVLYLYNTYAYSKMGYTEQHFGGFEMSLWGNDCKNEERNQTGFQPAKLCFIFEILPS